jgi:hypothetical protein
MTSLRADNKSYMRRYSRQPCPYYKASDPNSRRTEQRTSRFTSFHCQVGTVVDYRQCSIYAAYTVPTVVQPLNSTDRPTMTAICNVCNGRVSSGTRNSSTTAGPSSGAIQACWQGMKKLKRENRNCTWDIEGNQRI